MTFREDEDVVLLGLRVLGSNRMTAKKSVETISAAEAQLVG